MDTPDFFEEKDMLGQPKPKIPVTGSEDPAEIEGIFDENGELRDASKSARFFNYILDSVGTLAFSVICVFVLNMIGMKHLVDREDRNFILLLFSFVYYVLFEGVWGTTPGKLVTGTRVVNEKCEKIDFGNALGRTLCRFIPFDALSFLFMQRGGWHDSITKTRVVETR